MSNDFVTDVKPPVSIYFNGQKRRITDADNRADHTHLRTLWFIGKESDDAISESVLADKCGHADRSSVTWKMSLERLESHGYICIVRSVWDGVKNQYTKLPDPRVTLLNKGLYFATMTFEQAMRVAKEPVSVVR
jgi:hypothetical protein